MVGIAREPTVGGLTRKMDHARYGGRSGPLQDLDPSPPKLRLFLGCDGFSPCVFRTGLGKEAAEFDHLRCIDILNVKPDVLRADARDRPHLVGCLTHQCLLHVDPAPGPDHAVDENVGMRIRPAADEMLAVLDRAEDHLRKKCRIRREDVFIGLVEVAKENWSFGNGIAQYA